MTNSAGTYLVFKVGEYEITEYSQDSLWIQHESGEGMEVGKREFEKLIDEYYQETF